ncbi:dopamine D2-like receptor [Ruditapes philippinarum]|uniref:dopamine D2-like receptor n=1 Tax=Ruditapes philippinarum TaxID=129788 RepID=UPI00295ABB31|nr:dopamine D2-like receptor [Ruditapes philippinarum]XP_060570537.1 dopamine D2-like receptor [Ruditapes philippinarum]
MWSVVPMMYGMNGSSIESNDTCFNGTCIPVPGASVKWGLLALIVVILCTALGNLLVCLAVCWERRLQNMTNYFLMSLAIADFLVSIIVMPFGMVVEIYGYFPLGAQFCAFWVTMDVLMCTASIWHMCTMSMDRYFTLKYPMQYGRNKTKTMVAVKIVFVWIVSFTISSPISIYGLSQESSVFNDRTCVITVKEFAIYGSIFAFYVPLIIMILTYTLTIRILWQNQHMMRTIDRSHFRMRPRNNKTRNKSTLAATMLSPPSSDSRRESHTDISSLARTPNIEKVNLPECTECDLKFLELKHALDKTYEATITAPITDGTNDYINHVHFDQHETDKNVGSAEKTDNSESATGLLNIDQNPMLNVPITMIQSPSSEDEDEHSALLSSSTERLSRSFSHSSTGSRFRPRTNTNVSSKSYLNTHSSLKIPKTYEKNNLQASVSCSNFTDSKSKEKALLDQLGFQGNGLNRDFRSLEWCHHFYEIQEEMDECLRESKRERKKETLEEAKRKLTCQPTPNLNMNTCIKQPTETNDSAIVISTHVDELKPIQNAELSESADSMDEGDSSSENSSDILSIKLHPKSVYMYKVNNVNGKPFSKLQSTVNENSALNNGDIYKRQSYVRESPYDSDKSSENNHKIIRKPSSIKRFIYKCKKRRGIKNLISSKTTSNERKASKVLGIIFAVFVILWTPFFIANILSATCESCSKYITPEMMSSFVWMGYIASLANPIIYTMFNTAFRTAFLKILSCKLCGKGRSQYHRSSIPSHPASMFHDRRQTLTVLINGQQDRIHSDFSSNGR